jgi:hypothetical protein
MLLTTRSAAFCVSVFMATAMPSAADTLIFYQSIGDDLLANNFQANTQYHIAVQTTNLTAVKDHIYWLDGRSIYQANPDLTDVTLFHFTPLFQTPTDFTLSPDGNTLYEQVGGDLFSLYLPTNTQHHISLSTTNLTAVNGHIYWLDGRSIYQANPDLTDVTLFHFDPTFLRPTDLAIGDLPTAVPEPSTWAMMLIGFAGLGFAGYRASRKAVSIAV